MKHRNNGGFSLVEMLVAIVILGLITVPMLSGMVVAMKTIARSEDMMKAQLAVSSAVETLMAEGIPSGTVATPDYGKTIKTDASGNPVKDEEGNPVIVDDFPTVTVEITPDASKLWFSVKVTSDDGSIAVETTIRAVEEVAS